MLTYARLLLYPGEVLRLDGHAPLTILCESGELWVTAGVEGTDHDLKAGQQLRCPKGRILVEGDGVLAVLQENGGGAPDAWRGQLPFRNMALLAQSPLLSSSVARNP